MRKKRNLEISDEILQIVLEANKTYNRVFRRFNTTDLTALSNYQLAQCIYGVGLASGNLDVLRDFANNAPDYHEAVTRLDTMRDKLYGESQRRDSL